MAPDRQGRTTHAQRTVRHFYAHLKPQYARFLAAIQGFSTEAERRQYAAYMLNRLITAYFLQARGLLDSDPQYLSRRLCQTQEQLGENNFYGYFLLALFHQRLGQASIGQGAIQFGNVPALDLPLFRPHRLEREYHTVYIEDAAFTEIFAFFDEYQWQLEEEHDDALHPGILADIFEQHINQKQMGAYYTEEDITSYIACNTIVSYFFDAMSKRCPSVFAAGASTWKLLQTYPERYIHASLQCSTRLPTETEREYEQRCARYGYVYGQLRAGAVRCGEDLITNNLNMLRFSLDVIGGCEDSEVVLACYNCLECITVLDPTCGSGAFLFAALHILRALYTTCLERLQALSKIGADNSGEALLKQVESYAQHDQFILTTIFRNNLYGVDLMEEASDMCKLRLFLTLLAHVEDEEEIPPLSAINFNIHAGNALVGFVHGNEMDEVDINASDKQPGRLDQQLAGRYGIKRESFADDNGYMKSIQAWRESHQPFHWCQAFGKVMERGGFDVIIGNPPYVEYSKVRQSYALADYTQVSCGNLYAAVIERSLALCRPSRSYVGLIVPLSLCGSERFRPLRASLSRQTAALWLANFEIFPSRLFVDAYQRQSILIAKHDNRQACSLHVTKIQRWYAAERPHLIQLIRYTPTMCNIRPDVFPKLASPLQESILSKVWWRSGGEKLTKALSTARTEHFVYYQEATNYWVKAAYHVPFYKKNGVVMEPSHGRFLYFYDQITANCVMALMNSSLFYIWFSTYSDGFHLAHALVQDFPTGNELYTLEMLPLLARQLTDDIKLHAKMSTRNTHNDGSNGQAGARCLEIELEEYQMSCSKLLLDRIDAVLAEYYGFTDEELDFIINYDCKYRMGMGVKDETI